MKLRWIDSKGMSERDLAAAHAAEAHRRRRW
jgi:hypothetical protein